MARHAWTKRGVDVWEYDQLDHNNCGRRLTLVRGKNGALTLGVVPVKREGVLDLLGPTETVVLPECVVVNDP